jgi:DNA-binding response OmpR family regulator
MVKKPRILIAEDERSIAQALQLKLNNSGFEANIAENGVKALDILAKEKFDLLLLDLIMPEMDGFGVLEELKKRNQKIRVIVSTNLSQEEDRRRVEAFGVKDYLVKSDTPITEIVKRVQRALG